MTDREIMQQALDALEYHTMQTRPISHTDKAIEVLRQALAQPEQASTEPPDYVEPPTSDYHNGWEEGFEAAKNLFKKESAPQNADPRLLLGRKDNCIALAQPEQEPVCDKDPHLCGFVQCQLGKVCKNTPINIMPTKIFSPNLEQILNAAGFYRREWVGLTEDDHKDFADRTKLLPILAKTLAEFIEAKLKEKNT